MKRALILGFGKSGKSNAKFLLKQGYSVLAIDKNANLLRTEVEENLALQDENYAIEWENVDLIVKSPGIPPFHPLVKKAKQSKKLKSEIDLVGKLLQEKEKILFAITGTNGKTTTTALVSHILNNNHLKAVACGNIGIPLPEIVMNEESFNYYVIELSSFQLWGTYGKYFDAGVILNLSPNHLDWHGSFHNYKKAKWSLKERLKPNGVFYPPYSFDKKLEEKVESILPLRYRGEKENILAAYALCQKAQLDDDAFLNGLETFKKPPHRLEIVKEKEGVIYINDSKATTVVAVLHAVMVCKAPLILIVGGIHKGDDFRKWISLFKQKVKKVFAIGRDKEKIAYALKKDIPVELVQCLSQAVEEAKKIAQPGDTVLLSPGCSSYDQFRNFEHRAEVFKAAI